MKITALGIILTSLIVFSCKILPLQKPKAPEPISQEPMPLELKSKIVTDKNNPRIHRLTGQWYSSKQKKESSSFHFVKRTNDSADSKINFKDNGMFLWEDKRNKTNPEKEGLWFLTGDTLYVETYVSDKGKCNMYKLINLSDSLLTFTYSGTRNIYEGVVCEGKRTYSYAEVPAKFGTTIMSFENYFNKSFKLPEQEITTDDEINVLFTINCEGEVCDIQIYYENTAFEREILTLLRQMPNWSPAIERGKTVNFWLRYKFSYKSGQLIVSQV